MIVDFILQNRWVALDMFERERMGLVTLLRLFSVSQSMRTAWCRGKDPLWIAVYRRRIAVLSPSMAASASSLSSSSLMLLNAFRMQHYNVLLQLEWKLGWDRDMLYQTFSFTRNLHMQALHRHYGRRRSQAHLPIVTFEEPSADHVIGILITPSLPSPAQLPQLTPTVPSSLRSICRQARKERKKEFQGRR